MATSGQRIMHRRSRARIGRWCRRPGPADCSDGAAAAYWRRPEAYLDPDVQRSISILARHAHLLEQDKADYGYRLVVANS